MYPIFRLDEIGTLPAIAAGQSLFGIAAAAIMGLVPTLLSEFFPTTVRMSALSVAYTLANALFGGTAPFVVLWLVGLTHKPTVVVFYCVGALLFTLAGALIIREPPVNPCAGSRSNPCTRLEGRRGCPVALYAADVSGGLRDHGRQAAPPLRRRSVSTSSWWRSRSVISVWVTPLRRQPRSDGPAVVTAHRVVARICCAFSQDRGLPDPPAEGTGRPRRRPSGA
jgi:MFS family permease